MVTVLRLTRKRKGNMSTRAPMIQDSLMEMIQNEEIEITIERSNPGDKLKDEKRFLIDSEKSKNPIETEIQNSNSLQPPSSRYKKKSMIDSEKSKNSIEAEIQNSNSSQPSGSRYKKKFLWPEKYLNRESQKESEPVEPREPEDIGKQSVGPFFGQVMESLCLWLNRSKQKSWNLCFKLGRKGETMQVWSFGTESEIKSLDRMLKIDSYIV